MHEISIFLKNKLQITSEEFRVLNNYSYPGKNWYIYQKPTPNTPYYIRERSLEYILDKETFFLFNIISQNILAQWNTEITKNLKENEQYHICDSLFICHYYR